GLGGRGAEAVRELRCARSRQAALSGGEREPQPLDGGEGEREEPGARTDAPRLRCTRPHRPAGDREGVVRQREAEPRRDRARRDAGPRPRADDRQRLAGGRPDGPLLHPAVRLTALPPIPYDDWEPTKETLHLWAQIVGKVRMASSHPR